MRPYRLRCNKAVVMVLKDLAKKFAVGLGRRRMASGAVAAALLVAGTAGCTIEQGNSLAASSGASKGVSARSGPRANDSVIGSYLAGRQARANREISVAADYFDHALMIEPNDPALTRRTFMLMLADGRMDRAVSLAEQVRIVSSRDLMANLTMASQAFRDGDYSEAREILSVIERSGFTKLLVGLLMAWSYAGEGAVTKAQEELGKLDTANGFDSFILFHRALIYDQAGRQEEAGKYYEETGKTRARDALRVALAYGSYLERAGDAEAARRLYADYIRRVSDNPVVGVALERVGNVSAKRLVPDAAAGAAETLYGAASVLAQDRARDAAVLYLRLALHIRPDYPIAQTLLADTYETDRNWQAAIDIYQSIEPSSEYSWNARIRTAWAYEQLNKTAEAEALLKSMAAERGQDVDSLVTLADILRSRKRFAESAETYGLAIDRVPDLEERHWALFYARGIAHERSNQWPRAEKDLLKALDLRPQQPLVLNYLGYSWADQGIHLDRAVEMIKQAVSLRPNDGYIVDSLGWVLYRLGRYGDAVEKLERAAELRPEDPVINDHLGDAYWQVGRYKEARFQWRRALSFEPETDQVPIIESKLAVGLVAPESAAVNDQGG